MGIFGQKHQGFGALPHRPSAHQTDGAWTVVILQRQGQGSAAAAPGIPGHGNCVSPFLHTSAPMQPKALKTRPPILPSSLFQTEHPHFFPSSPIGHVPQTPLTLPPPWTSSKPFTSPLGSGTWSWSGTRAVPATPAPLPHTVPRVGRGHGDTGSVPAAAGSAPFQQHDCKHTSQIVQPFFCCLSYSAGNWHL